MVLLERNYRPPNENWATCNIQQTSILFTLICLLELMVSIWRKVQSIYTWKRIWSFLNSTKDALVAIYVNKCVNLPKLWDTLDVWHIEFMFPPNILEDLELAARLHYKLHIWICIIPVVLVLVIHQEHVQEGKPNLSTFTWMNIASPLVYALASLPTFKGLWV